MNAVKGDNGLPWEMSSLSQRPSDDWPITRSWQDDTIIPTFYAAFSRLEAVVPAILQFRSGRYRCSVFRGHGQSSRTGRTIYYPLVICAAGRFNPQT